MIYSNFNDFHSDICNKTIVENSAMDWVFLYQLMKRLAVPFEKWPAFTAGIIDYKGELLREPTDEERNKIWGYTERFVRNLKLVITKFTGHSQLTAALVSLYMLKENVDSSVISIFTEKYLNEDLHKVFKKFSIEEIEINFKLIKGLQ